MCRRVEVQGNATIEPRLIEVWIDVFPGLNVFIDYSGNRTW